MLEGMPGPVLNMEATLTVACGRREVQSELGVDEKTCEELMRELSKAHARSGNYFPWCRSLRMYVPGYVSSMLDDLENDPQFTQSIHACEAYCPQISKMIRNFALGNAIHQDIMTFYPTTSTTYDSSTGNTIHAHPTPEQMEKYFEDMKKKEEALDDRRIQMCDFQETATCKIDNMHQNCTNALDSISPQLHNMFEDLWGMCDSRAPCNAVCHGVDTKARALTNAMNKLGRSTMSNRHKPTDLYQDRKDMCGLRGDIAECYGKEQCTDYIARGHPLAARALSGGSPYQPSAAEECAVYGSPCFATLNQQCKVQYNAAYEGFDVNSHVVGNLSFFGCLDAIQEEPPSYPPFWIDLSPGSPVRTRCCDALTSLTQCLEQHGCGEFNNEMLRHEMQKAAHGDESDFDTESLAKRCSPGGSA
jgi:hypothetical protein